MKSIKITLRAKDFKDTSFCSNGNCAIAKAARRVFTGPNRKVSEGGDGIIVDGVDYAHDYYGYGTFNRDEIVAHNLGYDDSIIRVIDLEEGVINLGGHKTQEGAARAYDELVKNNLKL